MTIDYFSAFFIGLLGSGHCLSMCGGITTMLTTNLSPDHNKLPLIFSYNIGRIFSYGFIGCMVGFTSSLAVKNLGLPLAYLRVFSGVFIILLGLYLGQWLMWLTKIETFGKYLWQYISPVTKHIIPVTTVKKSLLLGVVWGWLPCGLVYSMLTWSLATGDAVAGALLMASFGLGTLPMLLTMSFGVTQLSSLLTNKFFKKSTALLLIIYGIYSINIASYTLF